MGVKRMNAEEREMSTLQILRYTRFGDLTPQTRFRWGRWFEGMTLGSNEIFTKMKGNRYKDTDGRTWITGMGTAVQIVTEGKEGQ